MYVKQKKTNCEAITSIFFIVLTTMNNLHFLSFHCFCIKYLHRTQSFAKRLTTKLSQAFFLQYRQKWTITITMTNLFVLVIDVVTMCFNSHKHVWRWIADQIIKFWEPFYVYGVIQCHVMFAIAISFAGFYVCMHDEMVNHPKVNMSQNVGHLLFVLISDRGKQLM